MILLDRLRSYLELVRFSHTVFALPFALMSALVAAHGFPDGPTSFWILFCMVCARTCAMTFNRIADRHLDRLNPRTADRHLPTGKVSLREAWTLWGVSSLLFLFGAWMLNPLVFTLAFPAWAILCGYSYAKRYTAFCHFLLGFSLAIAPVGAWIAVTGTWSTIPLWLAADVTLWVAGFDVLYALLDEEFDRRLGIHSLVVRLGKEGALRAAFWLHVFSVVFAGAFGWAAGLGSIYFTGILGYAILILYEHKLVKTDNIRRINMAFFNVNGVISIGLFFFTLADVLWH